MNRKLFIAALPLEAGCKDIERRFGAEPHWFWFSSAFCGGGHAVGGDAGDVEAGALLCRQTRGQRNCVLRGDHRVFGGGAKRAESLRPEHHTRCPTHSFETPSPTASTIPAPSLCGMTRG
jgi:hypothetical protein